MVFQEYNLVERLTVMENVLSGRLGYVSPFKAWLRRYPQADIDAAFELLDDGRPGATSRTVAPTRSSGGQRQRVGHRAGASCSSRSCCSPTSRRPRSTRRPRSRSWSLLRDLGRARRFPVIVNIHDVELARRFADRIVGMSGGRVVYDGRRERARRRDLKQIYGGEDWLE